MAKMAVIKTGGKQYLVSKGDELKVEKLGKDKGKEVEFETLMVCEEDGKALKVGEPILKDVKVKGKVIEDGRAEKVRVVHYKPKTRYHKVYGHRQPFTKAEITAVA